MMEQPFVGTRKTEKLINRHDELERIYRTIHRSKAGCQVVLIYAPGGMGKSRLAEEILWRGGNHQMREQRRRNPDQAEDWSSHKTEQGYPVVYGDLIDLTDLQYNNRAHLINAVRDALVGEGEIIFNDYDRARSNYLSLLQVGADSRMIDDAIKASEISFAKDLHENEAKYHLVLIFDTTEKLELGASKELLDNDVLKTQHLAHSAIQWLVELLTDTNLQNTTLIFVGRDQEGKEFFDTICIACETANGLQKEEIPLSPFRPEDVLAYFQQLANDWQQAALQSPKWQHIASEMKGLSKEDEQARVLWLYTGGQPVRLAMYADVMVEGKKIPEPLKDTWKEAIKRVKTQDPVTNPTKELGKAQLDIEREFISLIFQQFGLSTRILKALVRTPRGLSEDQLVYILYAPDNVDLSSWMPPSNQQEEVKREIEHLLMQSIVKHRPNNRLGLQDEVYRIYARHMRKDARNRRDEVAERKKLYHKLSLWAGYQINRYRAMKQEFQKVDERLLQLNNPAQAFRVAFPDPGKMERTRRSEIFEAIRFWKLEEIHYDLLINLVGNFNRTCFDLSDRYGFSIHENEDEMILAEIHRILYSEDLLDFIILQPWQSLKKRKEPVEIAMRRVLRQTEFMQWMRRFMLRKDYDAVLEYYDKVEKYIRSWPASRDRTSFLHTLSAHERRGMYHYASLLKGDKIEADVKELDILIDDLQKLAAAPQHKIVFTDRGEAGFLGHPAESRLKIVLGQLYNFVGYGCASLGYSQRAQKYYTRAISVFRELKYSEEPTVTNNLSKVLSDQGSPYARLVCQEGLMRRKELSGLDIGYALSMNTLALIDNDSFRPDLAWKEAAEALAYFRRARDLRGEGLALLQLGEAQRRLARQEYTGAVLAESPETIYEQALIAIHRAETIFAEEVHEDVRLIEAYIELGCIHRDLVGFYRNEPDERNRNYRDALANLREAFTLAKKINHLRYQIDSKVNMTWTQFYYANWHDVEETLKEAEALFPDGSKIEADQRLPAANRDDSYVFYQWGKIYALRGRIALENFRKRTEQLKEQYIERSPQERNRNILADLPAQDALLDGAEAFTLAAGYDYLFSPRTPIVRVVEEPLYGYLKKLNHTELRSFLGYYTKTVPKYHLKGKVFLEDLIEKCLGIEK